MRIIIDDDGSPPVHALGNKERNEIATISMRWALPKGLIAAGVCIAIVIAMAIFDRRADAEVWFAIAFYLIAWPLGLFIWKRWMMLNKAQAMIDDMNAKERALRNLTARRTVP
jgi:hypothetical protein